MIYIITDTHFNHKDMYLKYNRPGNFEERIWKSLAKLKRDDILIHLGDFCIGQDLEKIIKWKNIVKCKTILIKGNHDKKSDHWYEANGGFSIVAQGLEKRYQGKNIYFSHIPISFGKKIGDINIHGHTHGNTIKEEKKKRTKETYNKYYGDGFIYNKDYNISYSLEEHGYGCMLLKTLLKKKVIN